MIEVRSKDQGPENNNQLASEFVSADMRNLFAEAAVPISSAQQRKKVSMAKRRQKIDMEADREREVILKYSRLCELYSAMKFGAQEAASEYIGLSGPLIDGFREVPALFPSDKVSPSLNAKSSTEFCRELFSEEYTTIIEKVPPRIKMLEKGPRIWRTD